MPGEKKASKANKAKKTKTKKKSATPSKRPAEGRSRDAVRKAKTTPSNKGGSLDEVAYQGTPDPDVLEVNGVKIARGKRESIDLPVAQLQTATDLPMPIRVVRGQKPGPVLMLSAAVHGDEINGVEIIRRVLNHRTLRSMRGTLLAVPVVNVFGFINHTRYLPDRRDLNRSFPGSLRGSLAARVADIFLREVASKATHCIDLHTGAQHRSNLPHLRCAFVHDAAIDLAEAFAPPLLLDSRERDGSLRESMTDRNIPAVTFEGGEALRFDEWAIRAGVRGVLRAMKHLGMTRGPAPSQSAPTIACNASTWARASQSGIMTRRVQLGQAVNKGDVIATISNPFGHDVEEVHSPITGIILGETKIPLVYEGDALFHVASIDDDVSKRSLEQLKSNSPAQLRPLPEATPENAT